jgi:predicted ferric reductase
MILFPKRVERHAAQLRKHPMLEDIADELAKQALRTADLFAFHCSDWNEGRCYAQALRELAVKYQNAKLHIPNQRES